MVYHSISSLIVSIFLADAVGLAYQRQLEPAKLYVYSCVLFIWAFPSTLISIIVVIHTNRCYNNNNKRCAEFYKAVVVHKMKRAVLDRWAIRTMRGRTDGRTGRDGDQQHQSIKWGHVLGTAWNKGPSSSSFEDKTLASLFLYGSTGRVSLSSSCLIVLLLLPVQSTAGVLQLRKGGGGCVFYSRTQANLLLWSITKGIASKQQLKTAWAPSGRTVKGREKERERYQDHSKQYQPTYGERRTM